MKIKAKIVKMVKVVKKFILILAILFSANLSNAAEISFNESVLPYKGGLLISNEGSRDMTKNSGYILYYKKGKFKTLIDKKTLYKPAAMAVYKNKLYVCDRDKLKIFDLKNVNKGLINPLIELTFSPDDTVLNDIVLYKNNLYITSTTGDRIYKLNLKKDNLKPELWLNIPSPNGITIKKGRAVVVSITKDYKNIKDENLVYIIKDINNPVVEKLNSTPLLYDGAAISKDNKKIYVSDWLTSSIYEVNMNGEQKVVFYKKGMTPADIALKNNKLIIPDMFNHRVIIYNTKTKKESCIK